MDCNTCDTAPTILINAPEVVEVSLTITEKAKEMLEGAFGDDRSHGLLVGVLSGGCSGYMYDLQIVESTEQDCQDCHDCQDSQDCQDCQAKWLKSFFVPSRGFEHKFPSFSQVKHRKDLKTLS